jgi:hypothetical protein
MKVSKIEQELLETTAVKLPRGNDRQKQLIKVMLAAANLPDDKWEGLSKEAQDWTNDNAEAYKAKSDVEDYPDLVDEEPELPVGEIDEEDEEQPSELVEEKVDTRVRVSEKRISACSMVKEMVLKRPSISVDEIMDHLKKKDLKVTPVTVASLRSSVRDVLRTINKLKLGNFQF